MNVVEVMGWIGIAAGAAVTLAGAYTMAGKLLFLARWKWGDAHQMKRSVKLGWNTGAMPDDTWVLVREHADGVRYGGGRISQDHQWALMKRVDDRAISASGGYSTPITNITGWLYVVEGDQ